jgi:hypothetical protein
VHNRHRHAIEQAPRRWRGKFDFHTVHDVVQVHEAVAVAIARVEGVPQYRIVVLINRFRTQRGDD